MEQILSGARKVVARITPAGMRTWWEDVRDNLWLLPTLATLVAAALSISLVALDSKLDLTSSSLNSPLLFGAGAEGARGVLGAIAGSIIAVTGTVFSIVIVALQLASGQFTPRVMRHFTADRINQSVLAIFIGTFTYSLLVLRTIRVADEERGSFVPSLSVSAAILLALICIAALILFIHHSANQLQVWFILERAANDTIRLLEAASPDRQGRPALPVEAALPTGASGKILATSGGYLQDMDIDKLRELAERRELTIQVLYPHGAHLLLGTALVRFWHGGHMPSDDDQAAVRSCFVIGEERTLQHDIAFGVRQIADIAIKALSPGINDPTTATQAIDRLNEILVRKANQGSHPSIISVGGRPAIYLPVVTFGELVDVAFTQIRHYGAADLVVMAQLIEGLGRVAALVPEQFRSVLRLHARLALERGLDALILEEDRQSLREIAAWLDQDGGAGETPGGSIRTSSLPAM